MLDTRNTMREAPPAHPGSRRRFIARGSLLVGLGLAWVMGGLSTSAPAQVPFSRAVPPATYFAVFPTYFDGRHADALKLFRREGRGGIKTVDSYWIDSICYHTMTAECHYQLGQWQPALDHYAAALNLVAQFPDWMVRVQFPDAIGQASPQIPPPWGQSTRGSALGSYPEHLSISQGQLDNTDKFVRGGVVQRPLMWSINVVEIVRCTCLALRRYREILGPAAVHDPVVKQVSLALSRRPGRVNHWSEVWVELQLGMAQLAAGKVEQARPSLERGLLANGQFDHPLTSTALLELGRLAMAEGDLAKAGNYFEEATYAAYYYRDPIVLEDAFTLAATAHMLSLGEGNYPPLATAAAWARTADYRQLTAALLTLAAEDQAQRGQNDTAAQTINDAQVIMGRRELSVGRAAARLQFVTAQVAYARQDRQAGDAALTAALGFQTQAASSVARLGVVDRWLAAGSVSPRIAADLYGIFLGEPTSAERRLDPLDSLTRLVMPRRQSLENWFEILVGRKDWAAAVGVAEELRRERFLSTQELGGRLLALRWVLEAPPAWLPAGADLERQQLLLRYPSYADLASRAGALSRELAAAPFEPADEPARRAQREGLEAWARLSSEQEAWLRLMAVRREAVRQVFPPAPQAPELQAALEPRQGLLAFVQTRQHIYAYWLTRDKLQFWQADSAASLQKRATKLARDLGLLDSGRAITVETLTKTNYRQAMAELLEPLFSRSKLSLPGDIDELVVVPDGLLWYVPFEIMMTTGGDSPRTLLADCRIRYAPTAGLALAPRAERRTTGPTAIYLGRLHPRDDDEVAKTAFEAFREAVPGTVALDADDAELGPLRAGLATRLVVWDDLTNLERGTWEFPLLRGGSAGGGRNLAAWVELPWAAPEVCVLPGFHSAFEAGLKKPTGGQPGDELFLPLCSILSTGARTVLISRWRPAGQTSFDLAREFVAGLVDQESPSEAWQRAVLLASESKLDLDREPRVDAKSGSEPPTAAHPFFWAGYLLVDIGAPPVTAPPPGEPLAEADAAGEGAPADDPGVDAAAGDAPGNLEPAEPEPGASPSDDNTTRESERGIPGVGPPSARRP